MKILNASPGFGSPMTEDEVRSFLSNSKLNIQLGTVDEKGDPNVHPAWYYFSNNKIYVETSKGSKKVLNIRRKNTIYFCIDDETVPYKGVRGKGVVRISEDVKTRPREHVRDDAGHSSSATTDRYIDVELQARYLSAQKKTIEPELNDI